MLSRELSYAHIYSRHPACSGLVIIYPERWRVNTFSCTICISCSQNHAHVKQQYRGGMSFPCALVLKLKHSIKQGQTPQLGSLVLLRKRQSATINISQTWDCQGA